MTTARTARFWPPRPSGPDSGTGATVLLQPDDDDGLDWQDKALCAQADPDAFFPEKGQSNRQAKAVCGRCEVRAECLGFALENDVRFGIWGGLSEQERANLERGDDTAPRRCGKDLHEMTAENTAAGGRCRACKAAAFKRSYRRSKGLAA